MTQNSNSLTGTAEMYHVLITMMRDQMRNTQISDNVKADFNRSPGGSTHDIKSVSLVDFNRPLTIGS